MSEWAEILGVTYNTLRLRLKSGLPERLVFTGKDFRELNGKGMNQEEKVGFYNDIPEGSFDDLKPQPLTEDALKRQLEDIIAMNYKRIREIFTKCGDEEMSRDREVQYSSANGMKEAAECLYLWFFGGREMHSLHRRLEREYEKAIAKKGGADE